MSTQVTAIAPHGDVERKPTEIYGSGSLLLRVGNGGAGATGLIGALSYDYLSTLASDRSISWVCNHSRNTQLALHRGYIDVALTYERNQEALAASEGWSFTAGCVFHDHFCIAGPLSDPAKLRSATSLQDGLSRIAATRSLFHSRADGSATMAKERVLWSMCRMEPWAGDEASSWYKTSIDSPADALKHADAAGAYLLIDRATLLRQTALQTILQTTVYFEPVTPDDILMNSCYALHAPPTASAESRAAQDFIEYLLSSRGQALIASFGVEECGLPLFAPVQSGFERSSLIGGRPRDGKWTKAE